MGHGVGSTPEFLNRSISQTAAHEAKLSGRRRLPRALYGHQRSARIYNERDALIATVLHQSRDGDGVGDGIHDAITDIFHEQTPRGDGFSIVLMCRSLAMVTFPLDKEPRLSWIISWSGMSCGDGVDTEGWLPN